VSIFAQNIIVMGIFVNPNNKAFEQMLNSQIYIDKTMFIEEVNKKLDSRDNYMCVSRPRRFGKSVNMDMLVAYYSKGCDSGKMFRNLKISQQPTFEEHLNKHNVIKFDMKNFYNRGKDNSMMMDNISRKITQELSYEFPQVSIPDCDLAEAIMEIYTKTGEQFIVLMDEYDMLVREQVSQKEINLYIGFLEKLFKNTDLRPAFNLAYLTGILPIVRDQIQSKMNEFNEYTIISSGALSEFIGATSGEAEALCKEYNMDFDECRRWYNGYNLNGKEIFATKSIVQSMMNREYNPYWGITGSYESVSNYINLNFDGIYDNVQMMMAGEPVPVNIYSYLNTMTDFANKDDVFTYLIHLGYLGYDTKTRKCYIPNYEVRMQWELAIGRASHFSPIAESIRESEMLLERTIGRDEEYVAEALSKAHNSLVSPLKYNNEHAFQIAMVMAYYTARNEYYIIQELPTGKGYADIALIPMNTGKTAIIIELKVNGTSGMALQQIKNRQYDTILKNYRGEVLRVGINYDRESKKHQCSISATTR